MFAVREHVDGPLLGTIEARGWSEGHIELSWMTVPSRRGRKIATRATRAACAWCFACGADAVWASVDQDNAASLAVARAAGFREHARDETQVRLRAIATPARP